MVQVVFKRHVDRIVDNLAKQGFLEDQVVVITQDYKMGSLMARFIDRDSLRLLNAKALSRTTCGLEVYRFGIDSLPAQCILELDIVPARCTNRYRADIMEEEENLSYLFEVHVSIPEASRPLVESKAS